MKKIVEEFARGNLFSSYAISAILFSCFIAFIGCSKQGIPDHETIVHDEMNESAKESIFFKQPGLSELTINELKKARAATAKYQDIENALADNYEQIPVSVENMGHHFLKAALVDGEFDFTKPEILVYNKDKNGKHRLVAIEYAVPITEPEPSGFAGTSDKWDYNEGFGLWLLHAWVWEYNPMGVFNPTNPNVHLH